jgi:hypothetical protein
MNPLFQKGDGTWWFWDETWTEEIGPYSSQQEAQEQLEKYAKFLREGPEKDV